MKKKLLILSVVLSVIAGFTINTVKEFCFDQELWDAMGGDPSGFSVLPSMDEANRRAEQAALTHPELFTPDFVAKVRAKYGLSAPAASTPTQPSVPAQQSGNKTDGKQTAAKVTAYFTDMYGHVIGSTQVTAGTNIADSQFPKEVKDIETDSGTYTFDKWDYDGHKLYHDIIVRAIFKK